MVPTASATLGRRRSLRGLARHALLALLVAIVYSLYFSLVPVRPTAEDRWDKDLFGGPFANVLGQSGWWQLAYAGIALLALYSAKTAIVFRCRDNKRAVLFYAMICAISLPFLWVLVTTDWNNAHAELAHWFTSPVGLLLVPTIGFFCDLENRPYRTIRSYIAKTCAELILIPIWYVIWIFIEFPLGFYWI